MCIGAIVKDVYGRKGEIISIDFRNSIVVIKGMRGEYWTDKIKYIKVISYVNVM